MPSRCVTMREMSTAALPMRSIADTTCSTLDDLLGVALRARREHAHLAHLVHELGEALFELAHLFGHARVGEEQRRVPEVDHELGGVFRLREHGLQISWSVFHWSFVLGFAQTGVSVSPRITIARISDSAPRRSRLDVTIGNAVVVGVEAEPVGGDGGVEAHDDRGGRGHEARR